MEWSKFGRGRIYGGFGRYYSFGDNNYHGSLRCWFPYHYVEVSVSDNIYFLRSPENVNLEWKSSSINDKGIGSKGLVVKEDEKSRLMIARTTFQVPTKESNSTEC